MVVDIEALFVVEEKRLLINIHLNQSNEVYPRNINYKNLFILILILNTLFDDVGETIVVPFCK